MIIEHDKEFISNIDIEFGEMKACEICGDTVSSGTTNTICSSCNGIRESTTASKGSPAHHVCGCINTDRRNCPWCKKPCHHDTSLNPKILISPM